MCWISGGALKTADIVREASASSSVQGPRFFVTMERLTVLADLTDRTFPSNSNAPRSSGAAWLVFTGKESTGRKEREERKEERRGEREKREKREFASVRLFSGARKYGASKASWPIHSEPAMSQSSIFLPGPGALS
ncbi:hypothetical protein K0M31_004083 [Melipona bicolor]|uniref:Uncharacterized protein n=1 Tax=Melipona bicolor TaxID=60889 RepID=A0AA40FZ48_9HYME|nr:hypothetical protein K0M31_004083 [Melipona bicolor]